MSEEKDTKETMVTSEASSAEGLPDNIEKLLAERKKIDDMLKEKFTKQVTVMFTDIKGSTSFFESRGDIEGRLMVQKHNDLMFPLIQKSQGRVIKTIGDAIMAAFEDPVMAVRAATEMQLSLSAYNTGKNAKEQIHIRIGINSGEGIVESQDIFGDVVNVAARVESLCDADQILISSPVYDAVRKTDDIICRYVSQAQVKGKEEALEVYRVVWGEEDMVAGATRSGLAATAQKAAKKKREVRKRLEMDITREGNNLKITSVVRTEKESASLRPYEEMHVSMAKIEERCQEVITVLNRANTRGRVSKDILAKLRDVGQVLFDTLLTAKAKEAIRATLVQDLVFNIEDTLVQIPWELLYDGEQFLCQKFNMGRIVKTKRSVVNIKTREMARPLKMLILSDPRGDLKSAFEEGRLIREEMDKSPSLVNANQRSGQITADYIMEKLRNFDIVHYAGHADYETDDPSNSGWLLDGGKFTSSDIMKLVGGRPMPALVFSNACQSGQTEEWKLGPKYSEKIYGLANAFLLSGVQHYVGTFWEVLDEPSARFAEKFYQFMMEGAPIGEALRNARLFLIREYGEDTIVWASYMLYGDPGANYFDFAEEAEAEEEEPLREAIGTAQLRSTSRDTVYFDELQATKIKRRRLAVGAVVAVLLVIGIFFFVQWQRGRELAQDPYLMAYSLLHANQAERAQRSFEQLPANDYRRFEGLAAVFYEAGDTDKALEMSAKAIEMNPDNVYAHVISGNILFSQGKLDEAAREYEKATQQKRGASWQKAEAFNGLGRIYSAQGDVEKSLTYYGQAASFNPESSVIYTNQGVAFEKRGNIAEAASYYQKAVKANPQDPIALSLLADVQKKQQGAEDKSRQERIDKLIGELVESHKKASPAKTPEDAWTSKPITLSFVNFQQKGSLSIREGEDQFFQLKLNAILQEGGRVQILERELLDKLLEELKLSTTDLVDPKKALEVGKILAARLIATGSLMRYGKDLQASIRLTETETTSLKAAIAETEKDINQLAEKTARQIQEKLAKAYPVRGFITSLEGNQLALNIGSEVGVKPGMELKVLEEEKAADAKQLPGRFREIGTIQITAVTDKTAAAAPGKDTRGAAKGMRVEEVIR
ncbi:MAG: CHAT domain-containing protein [Proteobacteria bacterium]|nr:CHAT domain-containing protein [Pseudomonadota bacterium]